MKARTLAAALVIVFGVALIATAQDEAPAQQPPQRQRQMPEGGMMGGGMMMQQAPGDVMGIIMRAGAELQLTEEQRTQMRNLMRDNRTAMRDARQKLQEAQTQLRQAIFKADQAAANSAAAAVGQALQEDAQNQVRFMSAFRQMLTPEQIEKLNRIDINPPAPEAVRPGAEGRRPGQGQPGQGQPGQEPGQRRQRQQ